MDEQHSGQDLVMLLLLLLSFESEPTESKALQIEIGMRVLEMPWYLVFLQNQINLKFFVTSDATNVSELPSYLHHVTKSTTNSPIYHREPKLCFCISLQKSKIKLIPSVDLCQSFI
jgi:hypothetical protein